MSGWIKCSERMPELPKGGGKARVIAYTPARAAQSFANGSRFLYWNGIDWRYFDGGRFRASRHPLAAIPGATHE
ncbi:DUF551 domain-containing protein [Pseudomonas putida]|uniref:DUF551 domain-containing protein n=1 Tax=Pseudomonas putida TaxID=303 RepID=UPI000E026C39|nr:DUF551 domain-containing protein [Pseudomonas putida]SUF22585.1 Uncharacterised protein [Pseudomonas putida]